MCVCLLRFCMRLHFGNKAAMCEFVRRQYVSLKVCDFLYVRMLICLYVLMCV